MTFTAYEMDTLMKLDEIKVTDIKNKLHTSSKVEVSIAPPHTTDFTNVMRLLNVLIKKKRNDEEIDKLLKLILGGCDD